MEQFSESLGKVFGSQLNILIISEADDFSQIPPFDVAMGLRDLTEKEKDYFEKNGRHLWFDQTIRNLF